MNAEKKKFVNFIILIIFVSLTQDLTSAQDCVPTNWSHNDTACPKNYTEVYKEINSSDKKSMRWCCLPGSESELALKRDAPNCRATTCLTTTTNFSDLCSTLSERYIDGKKLKYEEVLRDPCTLKNGGSAADRGVVGLCCPPNSNEASLVTTMGAENNEFSHQVKLKLNGHCAGTIYNKRFVITASHCIVEADGSVTNATEMEVILGTNIADHDTHDYKYRVTRAIPHEQYSRLAGQPEFVENNETARIFNDIALLELDRDIKFAENIKALEIAKEFDPFKYADTAVIVGWGTTDTLALAVHLQKANFVLRKDEKCFDQSNGTWDRYNGFENQLLCVGGVMEGKWSYTAGGGDSGGPAVCRNENGHPVLCGITSFGGSDEDCAKDSVEESCPPSVYAEVSYFHDWIVKNAGPQDPKTLYKPYLYGNNVSKGQFEHQVHITSSTGKNCGGTLIAPDIVVTAAQCAVNGDGSKNHENLKVTTGINDLNKDKGQTFGVKAVVPLTGFKRYGQPVNVTGQEDRVLITDNFYSNDLAILKLDRKVAISPDKLPVLPTFEENFYHGVEVSFPRNTSRSGQLMSREFRLLDLQECQTRTDRMSKIKLNLQVDKNVLCGVEKYSGGSTCDRELGGGLITQGKDGKEILCGIQVFRLCELSIPNGFINMKLYSNWAREEIKKL